MTSLGTIFRDTTTPNVDSAHIDRGIQRWLAEIDPAGDRRFMIASCTRSPTPRLGTSDWV